MKNALGMAGTRFLYHYISNIQWINSIQLLLYRTVTYPIQTQNETKEQCAMNVLTAQISSIMKPAAKWNGRDQQEKHLTRKGNTTQQQPPFYGPTYRKTSVSQYQK